MTTYSRSRLRGYSHSTARELEMLPETDRQEKVTLQECRYVAGKGRDGDGPITVHFLDSDLELTTTSLLGNGAFGKVYAARSNGGTTYALKVSSNSMTEADWRRLEEEVAVMKHFLRHPHIVKFVCAGKCESMAFLVMERCVSKSLHDIIATRDLSIE